MDGAGRGDASAHRIRLPELVYGLYGRLLGCALRLIFGFKAAVCAHFVLEPSAPGRGLPNCGRKRVL